MTDPFETRVGILGAVWDTMIDGLARADSPARHLTLATVSPAGWPEARTVVLRAADTEAATVAVYTDLFSEKVRSLLENPRAAVHVWDPGKRLQIRLSVTVDIASGPEVLPIWDRMPEARRDSYGVRPTPGKPISHGLDYIKEPNAEAFAVLNCEVLTIDAVHLGEAHRRVIFSRSDDWAGRWLSP